MGKGVVFVVCIPTANYEHILIHGFPPDNSNNAGSNTSTDLLQLDVELRDKRSPPIKNYMRSPPLPPRGKKSFRDKPEIPLEKVLDELLKKLQVEHVVWYPDKESKYYEVIFPVSAGDPCENCLHCLTELGIGVKLNSVVSVLPCSVVYDGTATVEDNLIADIAANEEKKAWNNFVESVRSKLTVKQVVDGVRSGGELSFDYIMLVLTADCLAALGLVENNESNIVAAMLVSPLMGPVMSLTFGTIIADKQLMFIGFKSLAIGMFLSCLFGLIFGLILGTTQMPWGFGDWPTQEMRGRGNVRALWMGVLWALPSGTGVALAVLQGYAGPLIGVAISASLLPPVVNCGLFWALGCTWLLNKDAKIPHLAGEEYTGNSSYVPLYTDYLPVEFFINGIVSCTLTIINVCCIFITAIIVLKVKEVAAPYTSTPDLRRFWERDIRAVRETNRSTLRAAEEEERQLYMRDLHKRMRPDLDDAMQQAVREAIDDNTFRKVQRVSYNVHAPEEISRHLGTSDISSTRFEDNVGRRSNRNSALTDLAALDKLITSLLATQPQSSTITNRLRGSKKGQQNDSVSRGSPLPTIVEGRNNRPTSTGVRGLLQTLTDMPHRFSMEGGSEETVNLTKSHE